jgi:hypothetical protein
VLPALMRFASRLDAFLEIEHLRSWARSRWADMVVTLHWLINRTGDGRLLDTAAKLQRQGFPWREHFERFPYWYRSRREECDLRTHVVNNAMALKAPGVWFRQSGGWEDRDAYLQILGMLDKYHGQANGMFSGDEHLAGRSPSQGTELCAVVEFMYSLEVLTEILGAPELGDRLELVAFNALPATMSPDMWAHQYDQQVNQVVCRVAEENVYTTNGPDSNIFGLEPNFGCCTANMHQGWPKFASHLVMRRGDDGLAITALAPCEVATTIRAVDTKLVVDTDYPFGQDVRISLSSDRPIEVPVHVRVPGWAQGAHFLGIDSLAEPVTYTKVVLGGAARNDVTLRLPMHVQSERRHNDSVSIYRGPLLFALHPEEDWWPIGGEAPHQDWEVHPKCTWNYALELTAQPDQGIIFTERGVSSTPFAPNAAPVEARVRGQQVPTWGIERNAAGPPPRSPVPREGDSISLTLVP